jgi:O-phosphoseryl-tRNA(Cys) synthetase
MGGSTVVVVVVVEEEPSMSVGALVTERKIIRCGFVTIDYENGQKKEKYKITKHKIFLNTISEQVDRVTI